MYLDQSSHNIASAEGEEAGAYEQQNPTDTADANGGDKVTVRMNRWPIKDTDVPPGNTDHQGPITVSFKCFTKLFLITALTISSLLRRYT